MRLASKVAMITGGAHGMGAAEAKLFAQEGAKVAIADVREEDGRKLEAEITEGGGEAFFVALDVSQEDQWQSAVDQVISHFGKLDILVNNAGISGSDVQPNRFHLCNQALGRVVRSEVRGVVSVRQRPKG